MAQHAEFEEKEYEQPLNIELLHDISNPLWPPGQVFEEHFGIDVALQASNDDFWKIFNRPAAPAGIILNDYNWGYIWRKTGTKRILPTFKTNLLLQTKRSQHRIGRNMSYVAHGIGGQYWLFEVTKHQQQALETLSRKVSNRALICYASPAFHTLSELYNYTNRKSLVANSSFVEAKYLSGHNRWVYDQPGNKGLACSKIDKINGEGFYQMLKSRDNNSNTSPLENLLRFESDIVESMIELVRDNPVAAEFGLRTINFDSDSNQQLDISLQAFRAFSNISTFCNLTDVNWMVSE